MPVAREDDHKLYILGINGSLTKYGESARNLKSVLRFVEKQGGRTKLIHLVDLDIFPPRGGYLKKERGGNTPYLNEDTRFLFQELLSCDGFVLSTSVHWRNPASPTVVFLEKLDILESANCQLEGKVAGIVVNYELEEGGVGATLLSDFSDMGIRVVPYGKVCCNFVSNRLNRFGIAEKIFYTLSDKFRQEVDGSSQRLEALAENLLKEIEILHETGRNKPGFLR